MSTDTKLWNNPHGQAHRPLTVARRALFLKVLAETGNYSAAARAASPHAKPGKSAGAVSSFKALENRDATFRAAVTDAIETAKSLVEEEIRRRGQEGWLEPVYQKGERVYDIDPETGKQVGATIRRFDTNLLLARARMLMPEKYSERKQLEISGSVTHVGCLITPQDIAQLSSHQQHALADVLRTLAINRGESSEDVLPLIDVTPQPAEPLKLGRAGFTSKKPPGNRKRGSSVDTASAKKPPTLNRLAVIKNHSANDPAQAPCRPKNPPIEAWELLG